MSKPLAICIEDLDAQSETKYVRCVALAGRQPGLRLDRAGSVLWQSDDGVACELWVSADERLILYRPAGATRVILHRAGRSLDVPCGKPVVVIDKDRLDVGARRLRIHVHGEAPLVAAPSPLPAMRSPLGRLAQAATAAAVIGAVVTTGGCIEVRETPPTAAVTPSPTIEVRETPPVVVMPTATVTPSPTIEVREMPPTATAPPLPTAVAGEHSILQVIQGEWTAAQAYDVEGEKEWTSGTLTIEGSAYTFTPDRQVTGSSVEGNLDFLFDVPEGELTLEYPYGVTPDDAVEGFAPGDVVATCVFRANAETLGVFHIRVEDADSLHFTDPSGEVGLWSITKPLEADSSP